MPTKKAAATKTPMSASHKAALAKGREEGRVIRAYLEAAEAQAPKRGRKRTPESINKQLDDIDTKLTSADPLTRVNLLQQSLDLQAELARQEETVDLSALEAGFISAVKDYSERKGITKAAWRAAGVPASVLKEAGI